jgi:hypothetical protein
MVGRSSLLRLASRINEIEARVKQPVRDGTAAREWLIRKFDDIARKAAAEDDARLAEAVADLVGDCPPEELEERLRELAHGRPAHDQ